MLWSTDKKQKQLVVCCTRMTVLIRFDCHFNFLFLFFLENGVVYFVLETIKMLYVCVAFTGEGTSLKTTVFLRLCLGTGHNSEVQRQS